MRGLNKHALYEGRKVRIFYYPKEKTHYLFIGNHLTILKEKVLDELSRTKPEDLERKLAAVDGSIKAILEEENLTYEFLSWAISQARIIELEHTLNHVRARAYGGWDYE